MAMMMGPKSSLKISESTLFQMLIALIPCRSIFQMLMNFSGVKF